VRGVADADEVDVALAVDLSAREEEHVDAALAGAIEQLAPPSVKKLCRRLPSSET